MGQIAEMSDQITRYRQRANIVAHLPDLLEELGAPLARVLDGTGIKATDLLPGVFLPYGAVLAMLDRAAEISGREDIGVLLAMRLNLDSLGPAGQVMRHAATLGEALHDYVQFQIWNSTGGAAYVYRTGQDFAFGYGIYDPAGIHAVVIHDLVMAAGCRLVFILTDGKVKPVEIWSMRPPPDNPLPLERFAGCPVRYGQEQSCIFMQSAAADTPMAAADRAAHEAALARLAERTATASWGTVAAVRHALRASMAADKSSMPEVAAKLTQHPRSLRRALEREGTTFVALRDDVRYTVARELLSLTPLPMSDIAGALGFGTLSSFSHAFRHWSGETASNWRVKNAVIQSNTHLSDGHLDH
jgi:AraC-like DNA-binding protein